MQATSSLTLRALFKAAIARTRLDQPAAVTAGLSPAAKALAAVADARSTPGVLLVVVPTDKDLEQQVCDIRFFWGAIEGADDQALDRAVLPFPSHQVDPYRGMTPHFRVSAARARPARRRGWHRPGRRCVGGGPPAPREPPRTAEARLG